MSEPETLCAEAVRLHQAGQLAKAEALYGAVLAAEPAHVTARHLLGVLRHQQNRNDEALALLAAVTAEHPQVADAQSNHGAVLKMMGRNDEALRDFQAERVNNTCTLCGTFEVAAAFAKLNQPDSARAYYEEYLKGADGFRLREDVDHLAATYQRLGELYEATGDRAKARDNYAKLLDLWKTADSELQPIVADTRQRVARLSAEH